MQISVLDVRRVSVVFALVFTLVAGSLLTVSLPAAHGANAQGDVVFVIDESGSMGPIQGDVRNNVKFMASSLTAAGVDTQFGLIGYGTSSHASNQDPHTHTDLTTLTDFENNVDNLVASGGLEKAFDAVVHAGTLQNYREQAGTCVVLVTDEDNDTGTHTQQDAIDELNNLGGAFFGIFNPNFGNSSADFDPLANQTGGQNFDLDTFLNDPEQVLADLGDACAESIEADVAVDVHPTSCPNPINQNSRGVVPAAILGTGDLDVTDINTDTARMVVEGNEVAPLRSNIEDVATPFEPFTGKQDRDDCTEEGPDGIDDLTLKFSSQEVSNHLSANVDDVVVVEVTGELNDGTPFRGEDVLWVRK